jgi:hypothetical protein
MAVGVGHGLGELAGQRVQAVGEGIEPGARGAGGMGEAAQREREGGSNEE